MINRRRLLKSLPLFSLSIPPTTPKEFGEYRGYFYSWTEGTHNNPRFPSGHPPCSGSYDILIVGTSVNGKMHNVSDLPITEVQTGPNGYVIHLISKKGPHGPYELNTEGTDVIRKKISFHYVSAIFTKKEGLGT